MVHGHLTRSCLAGLLVLLPAGTAAQTVDELVDKHIAARGGMERLKAIGTLRITRTVGTGIGATVQVIISRKRPHFYRVDQTAMVPGAPTTSRGVNAEDAWDTVGGKIVTRPEAAEAETREIDADFDGLLVDWKDKGHTLTYEGREALPGGEAFKLRVKTKSGVERTIYLDAATYLERRHTGVMTLPNGRKLNVVVDFANWKEVNGVKFAFDITEDRTGDAPAQSLVVYTDRLEANVPLDDALFGTPRG